MHRGKSNEYLVFFPFTLTAKGTVNGKKATVPGNGGAFAVFRVTLINNIYKPTIYYLKNGQDFPKGLTPLIIQNDIVESTQVKKSLRYTKQCYSLAKQSLNYNKFRTYYYASECEQVKPYDDSAALLKLLVKNDYKAMRQDEQDDTIAEGLFSEGKKLAREYRYAEAVRYFELAAEQKSEVIDNQKTFVDSVIKMRNELTEAEQMTVNGEYGSANKMLIQLGDRYPDNPYINLASIRNTYLSGGDSVAIDRFRELRRPNRYPNLPAVSLAFADFYFNRKMYVDASTKYREYITMSDVLKEPISDTVYARLYLCRATQKIADGQQGHTSEAFYLLDTARQYDDGSSIIATYQMFLEAETEKKRLETISKLQNIAMSRSNPAAADADFLLFITYRYEAGKEQDAINYLRQAAGTSNYRWYNELARYQMNQGDFRAAIESLNNYFVKEHPPLRWYYTMMGEAKLGSGDYNGARYILDEFMNSNQNFPDAENTHVNYAYSYFAEGKDDDARAYYIKHLNSNSKNNLTDAIARLRYYLLAARFSPLDPAAQDDLTDRIFSGKAISQAVLDADSKLSKFIADTTKLKTAAKNAGLKIR